MGTLEQTLKEYWGYDSFRPPQKEIIESVLGKHDTLSLLPTGAGKSLCFQLPALLFDGLCLVVSPLISLIQDQVKKLKTQNIRASAIHNTCSFREINMILDNASYGKTKFLYIAPERIETTVFKSRLPYMNLALLAVDEAHCISKWGHDFRPAYRKISAIRQIYPQVPCIALTATATPKVVQDIESSLELKNPKLFKTSFERSNLYLAVKKTNNKINDLEKALQKINKLNRGAGIIFSNSRHKTVQLSQALRQKKFKSDYYHAGLSGESRQKKQAVWQKSPDSIMVSTNAFGMGIDKTDVRFVFHTSIPENIEAYYQEVGRAGRDGKQAFGILLYDTLDIDTLKKKHTLKYPPQSFIQKIYQSLANYYQIPINSGYMSNFDFELSKFCNLFKTNILETFYALKQLENYELIKMEDGFLAASKILITISYEDLYEFQVKEPSLENMINALLRFCGGKVFNTFSYIDEEILAKTLFLKPQELVSKLRYLEKNEVLIYEKSTQKPKILFLQPRLDSKDIQYGTGFSKDQKERDEAQLQAILHFVTNKSSCRMKLLMNYFDEVYEKTCGHCDICVNQRRAIEKEKLRSELIKIYEIKILEYLIQPKSLDSLLMLVEDHEKVDFMKALEHLKHLGKVKYNEKHKLERN